MNLRKNVSTALTLFVIFSLEVSIQAEEGFFFKDTLPPALSSAWEATFIVYDSETRGRNGTAFVVEKENLSYDHTRLTLLSADHVVQKICGRGLGFCDMVLSASVGFHRETRSNIFMDHKERTIYEARITKRAPKYDLTVLKVTVDRTKYESIRPIPLANCDELYTDEEIYLIGFPQTNRRTAEGAKFIEKAQHRIRRWSRGYMVERVEPGKWNAHPVSQIGTTADALEGSSGGPALNNKGEFWGLVSQTLTLASKESDPYLGREGNSRRPHSLVVECWHIEKFLSL